MAITVIVAELPKPEIPSSGLTSPSNIKITVTKMAVISTGSHSVIKSTKARTKTLRVRKIAMGMRKTE